MRLGRPLPFLVLLLWAGPLPAQDGPVVRGILANGYRFGYVESGHGAPVVLVHGAFTDYRFWLDQLGTLGDSTRVIAYSRRHHYPNPWRPDDPAIGFENHAWDLLALVRALELGRPVLVGHSWGGLVVLEAALRQPTAVRAVILVEPLADSLIPDTSLRAASARRTREAFAAALARFAPADPLPALRFWLAALYGETFWDAVGSAGQGRLEDNAHTLPSAGAPEPAVSCQDLAALPLPVLLIGGSGSAPRQQATLDGLMRCLPVVTRVTVADAGPLLSRTHPEAFAEAVREFLAALP